MDTSVLPELPIDFPDLAEQAIAMLGKVTGGIVPYLIVCMLAYIGIQYLANVLGGNGVSASHSWDGHSDDVYKWFCESKDRWGESTWNRNVPEWVKDRIAYEDAYRTEVAKQERYKARQAVIADMKSRGEYVPRRRPRRRAKRF